MAGRMRRRRGQSTLEYILVVAAILGAIIGVAILAMQPGVNETLKESGEVVKAAAGKLKTSLGL